MTIRAFLRLILLAVFTFAPEHSVSAQVTKMQQSPSPLHFEDEAYLHNFSKPLANLIKTVVSGKAAELEGRRLSEGVWTSRIGLPGFQTAVLENKDGTLEIDARYANPRDSATAVAEFEKFVAFVRDCLTLTEAEIQTFAKGTEMDTWLGMGFSKDGEGRTKDVAWEHSRVPVRVGVLRTPTVDGTAGSRFSRWDFYLFISRNPRKQ